MRMKTFAKTVALFVVMALMMLMTISAATVTDVDVSFNASTRSVKITATHPDGAEGEGETINVIVVANGTADVYWNDAVADEHGKVTFTFTMDPATDPSGTYVAKVGGAGIGPYAETDDTYLFVNNSAAAAFLNEVEPKSATELQTYLEETNGGVHYDFNCALGSDYRRISDEYGADIATILDSAVDDYYTDSVYDAEDYYALLEKFNQAVTIALLNGNAFADDVDVIAKYKDVFGFETDSTDEFDTQSTAGKYALLSSGQRKVVEAALLGRTPQFRLDDGAEVLATFNEATALALYNDMNQSTKGNLVDYITYTNGQGYPTIDLTGYNALPSDTYKDMVRDAMANATFTSFADVVRIYNEAVEEAEEAYEEAKEDDEPNGPSGPSSSITITPVLPVVPVDMFDDLGSVEWAKTAINELAKKGVVNGVADRTFAPNDVLTREQFVKILVGALDIKATGNVPFTDVVASEWYANFVAIAYNSGIVNGTSETEFGVGDSLTREQLCTMVYRAIKASGVELKMVNGAANFVDSAEISDWAKEAVDYLYKAGVVNGVGGNAFDPQGTTTRAMGAKVIYGVLEGGVK